jgi:hypothetical protein
MKIQFWKWKFKPGGAEGPGGFEFSFSKFNFHFQFEFVLILNSFLVKSIVNLFSFIIWKWFDFKFIFHRAKFAKSRMQREPGFKWIEITAAVVLLFKTN